jgi:hypothetical protein
MSNEDYMKAQRAHEEAVIQMLRFGRAYSVKLACGHKLRATVEEAHRDQLFIGKMVRCAECRD